MPDGDRSRLKIILWWEARRIPYNIIVGSVGLVCIPMFYFFTANEPIEDGEDIGEPIMLFVAPFLINVSYTLGWVVEAFSPQTYLKSFPDDGQEPGPRFLRLGLRTSIFLVLLPTLVWAALWLGRILGFRH